MREKNLVILCIIFAVLVGLVFFKKSIEPEVPTTEEIVDIVKPSISLDNLSEITLRLGDGKNTTEEKPKNVHLVKEGDRWVVKTQYGVYANDKIITPALEKIDQLNGELRSNKEGLFEDYGITDDKALHFILGLQDSNPIHLIIGLEKAGFQNNFIRFAEQNAVYVVNENLLSALGVRGEGDDLKLDDKKWTDKHIIFLDVNKVDGIQFSKLIGGLEMKILDLKRELINGKKQWKSAIPYDFGLSATKIKKVLEVFNNTYSREVIDASDASVFDDGGWTGIFTMDDGKQVKLVQGAKDTAGINYYLKREGEGYYYLILVSTFDSRKDKQGNIFASNPFKVEESNVEEIYVESFEAKKKFMVVKKTPPEPDAEAQETEGEDQEKKAEDFWETSDGEKVEPSKIRDIINKIKAISMEIALKPDVSVDNSMVIRITKEGVLTEYTIGKDIILSTGKECRFLKIKGNSQSYCASKPSIIALQNALP